MCRTVARPRRSESFNEIRRQLNGPAPLILVENYPRAERFGITGLLLGLPSHPSPRDERKPAAGESPGQRYRASVIGIQLPRHTSQSRAAMQNTAKAASPPIMVTISSSQLDIGHPTRPAAHSAR